MNFLCSIYGRGVLATFCFTFGANLGHNLVYNHNRRYKDQNFNKNLFNVYSNPVNFLLQNWIKSTIFGICFPIIPYILATNSPQFFNIYSETFFSQSLADCGEECFICVEQN